MKSVTELKEKLENSRPEEWSMIPDLDLYMDQIIAYMKRQHIGLEDEHDENLTPAMINNYIKSGLLPRAKGKKYNREHIGYMTFICLLKQILTVSESGVLLSEMMQHQDMQTAYENYKEVVDREFSNTAECLSETASREEISQMALELAVSSYVQKYACHKMIQMLEESEEEEKK